MDTQKQRVHNGTRQTLLSEGVNAVDATFEHLTVLRVLIEGLAGNEEAGLWLKNVKGIPVVPRISPIDLVYLDQNQQVVEAVELLPSGEMPTFRAPAVSALVLPFQTLRTSTTAVGDRLSIGAGEMPGMTPPPAPEVHTVSAATAPRILEAVPESDPSPAMGMKSEPAQVETPQPAAATPRSATRGRKANKVPRARTHKARQIAARPKAAAPPHTPFIVEQPAAPPAAAAPVVPITPSPASAMMPPVMHPAVPAPAPRVEAMKPRPVEAVPARPAAEKPANKTAQAKAPVADRAGVQARPMLRWLNRGAKLLKQPEQEKHADAGKKTVHEHVERLLKWLSPNIYNEERRASIRRPAVDLVAYSVEQGTPHRHTIGDISSSGIYLKTDEHWKPGEEVKLSLQRSGPMEQRSDRRMDVEAEAVRHTGDGLGLAFRFPQGVYLDLWETAVRGKTYEAGPEYIVHEMRQARALGTIRRICPAIAEEAKQMLQKEFSNVRMASTVRIAYVAEELLEREAKGEPWLAPVEFVRQILETGSWADVDWIQDMWGGLLASCCSSNGEDHSNEIFIDMMSRLTPVHMRLLSVTSERAAKPGPAAGPFSMNCCTAGELTKALDLSNLTKMLRSIQDLAEMGLLAAAKRSPSDPHDDSAKTAITPLGLEMVARWQGKRLTTGPIEVPAPEEITEKPQSRLGVTYSAHVG